MKVWLVEAVVVEVVFVIVVDVLVDIPFNPNASFHFVGKAQPCVR